MTGLAVAADMAVKAPPRAAAVPPVINWTGFYVGGNLGGGWGNGDVNYVPNDPITAVQFPPNGFSPPPNSFHTSGVIGGLQIGYNYQFDRNWLLGIETDFDWSNIKGSNSNTFISGFLSSPITQTANESIDWFGTVRGRLGYLPTDNFLAYVTGGFAYGRIGRSAVYTNSSSNGFGFNTSTIGVNCNANSVCFAGSSNKISTGWTLGGGIEYALWQHWTVKAEYLYVSLGGGSVTEFAVDIGGLAPASYNANFNHANFNVVRAGLNYQFH